MFFLFIKVYRFREREFKRKINIQKDISMKRGCLLNLCSYKADDTQFIYERNNELTQMSAMKSLSEVFVYGCKVKRCSSVVGAASSVRALGGEGGGGGVDLS